MPLALKVLGVVAVTTYMLQTGLATTRGELATSVRRHKGELARAVVLMLVLGPLAARVLVGVFGLAPQPGAALVLLSLVGVVPLASRGARNARADVSFAVVLTVVLGIVAAFTAVPTTRLLLGYKGPLDVPPGPLILQVLLLQGLPLGLGIFVRSKTERARALEKALGIFNSVLIAVLLVIAVALLPRYGVVRALGWTGALAAFLFALVIEAFGYLLTGPDRGEGRTVAAVANMPNVMLALLIVTSASVDPGFAVAIVGIFIVRLIVGVVTQKLLARSATRTERRGPQAV